MSSSTEQAVKRLEEALQTLEHVVDQGLSQATGAETLSEDALSEEVQMLTADRVRLAESLDQIQARAAKLETINRDVSRRLDSAIETIRAVLATDEEGS